MNPLVFETSASTDSAIRASHFTGGKGKKKIEYRVSEGAHFLDFQLSSRKTMLRTDMLPLQMRTE
jgi:hypothetical protein